jgi:methionyl aminopeptidase
MIHTAKKALKLAITKAKKGNTFGDIGNTIQRYVEYQGFGVVRELCGHGIGHYLHEDPQIPNYGQRHKGLTIEPGVVFCIEPMITMGDWHLKKSSDGFGYETADGSLSAHFEHTIAMTPNGPEILTVAG